MNKQSFLTVTLTACVFIANPSRAAMVGITFSPPPSLPSYTTNGLGSLSPGPIPGIELIGPRGVQEGNPVTCRSIERAGDGGVKTAGTRGAPPAWP